ncbi:MAG: hypothetical protein Q9226_001833 [Calogaya cf. arnoldii]
MEESPGKMYALAVVMTLLATVATALRFYSRHIKKAGFSWDDWTVLPALVRQLSVLYSSSLGDANDEQLFTIVMAICIVIGSARGDLARHMEITTAFDDDGVEWPFPVVTDRTAVFLQIWALKMPLVKKLAVCGVFLLGILTVLAGAGKVIMMLIVTGADIDPDLTYWSAPIVYFPLVEAALGIVGACLPLYRPLFAGVTSRGFMRDLQSVDVPTTEQKTLWNNADDSRAVEEWNSSISTVNYGSDSQPSVLKEKGLPSLPASSLKMLSNAPSEGPWMKGPKAYHNMV